MLRRTLVLLLVLATFAGSARALGPHELAVVVNGRSAESCRVADTYARLRRIPPQNIVRLDLPFALSAREIALPVFRSHILEPVRAALEERGVADHIHAWAYSVAFPVRVTTSPPTSLTGMTFTGGVMPPAADVQRGLFASLLFADPVNSGGPAHYSQTLDMSARWLGSDAPTPAMFLGVIGERGNTVDEVEECLRRGASCDRTCPTGRVVFVDNRDVRAGARRWQFRDAAAELRERNVLAEIMPAAPSRGIPLIGLTAGSAGPDPARLGPYLPGCIVDNLTSLGAVFETANQTKVTDWIRAGATVATGTITEPLSIWMKFPTARVHVHQAAGCTAIESLHQSVRCPLQLLAVGDPLAAPWQRADARLRIHGSPSGPATGKLRLSADLDGPDAGRFRRFMYLMDGRVVSREEVFWLDCSMVAGGRHVLRCVAYSTGFVRHQVFAEAPIDSAGGTP